MAKSLLTLVLMATQLLAGSPSALYLCLGDDGSVGIDFGPDNCGRCDHSPGDDCAATTAVCPDAYCQDHSHADHHGCSPSPLAVGDDAWCDAGCDCIHIQISQPQCPTLSPAVDPSAAQRLALLVMPLPGELGSSLGVVTDDGLSLVSLLRHSLPIARSACAPTILRC